MPRKVKLKPIVEPQIKGLIKGILGLGPTLIGRN